MRCVLFTNKEVDLEGLEIEEIYIIFAKGAKGSITISERGEMLNLALSKMPILKRAEELIEKLEKKYNVVGMSVVFEEYEKELDRVLEAQKPHIVVAGRYMPITDKLLQSESAILFSRGKLLFDRLLYVHTEGAKAKNLKEWLKKGKEILIVGVVEPMLPPETHAKKMREKQEKIKKEIEEISESLNAEKAVLVGNLVEEVKRIIREFDADMLILSKAIGKEIERIWESTEVPILVL